MNADEARRILGLSANSNQVDTRAAHRRAIRAAHPDAGGTTRAAARINAAFATLQGLPDEIPAAPPPAATGIAEPPEDVDRLFVVDAAPGDLLRRLAEAGHAVGEVVYIDKFDGILEIVVGTAPGVGQLAVTVGEAAPGGTPVSFTLEPLGVTPAPPIGPVVDELIAALRR